LFRVAVGVKEEEGERFAQRFSVRIVDKRAEGKERGRGKRGKKLIFRPPAWKENFAPVAVSNGNPAASVARKEKGKRQRVEFLSLVRRRMKRGRGEGRSTSRTERVSEPAGGSESLSPSPV